MSDVVVLCINVTEDVDRMKGTGFWTSHNDSNTKIHNVGRQQTRFVF